MRLIVVGLYAFPLHPFQQTLSAVFQIIERTQSKLNPAVAGLSLK